MKEFSTLAQKYNEKRWGQVPSAGQNLCGVTDPICLCGDTPLVFI